MSWRPYVLLPLVVWLAAVLGLAGGSSWAQRSSEHELQHRFAMRVSIGSDFVANHVSDLINRQRAQAVDFLSDPDVSERQMLETAGSFGYSAAVLLDSDGRLLQVVPANPAMRGIDLTTRYEHLRRAVRDGVPVVSHVVPSAVKGVPVVAFAVPFDTPTGRRVFSGGLQVQNSPLGSYLEHAIALPSSRVYLLDPDGKIVATDRPLAGAHLSDSDASLTSALNRGRSGGYRETDQDWYFESQPVPGTPWRLVAAVPTPVLYAPTRNSGTWRLTTITVVALAGLVAVIASARSRRARRRLHVSEQLFREVFDHSLIGMFFTSPTGQITRVNPAFADMLGEHPEQLIGRHVADIIHPDDAHASTERMHDLLAGRISGYTTEKRYRHANGHTVNVALSTVLLRDDTGAPLHFATQVVDVTERERREAELAVTNTALREAHERVADLVGMLSHDVRQPLAVISGYIDTVTDDWDHLTELPRRQFLERASAAARRMSILVEDILALTHLDAGTIQPRRATIDVREAIANTLDQLPVEDATAVTAHLGQTTAFATIDPGHLQQILLNLVGNALKYGQAPVKVSLTVHDQNIDIAVSDHGDGVPEEFVPQLFARFTRATTGITVTKPGTGLGLYIVSQLAEANHATITYQHNRPTGARFTLHLRAAPLTPANPSVTMKDWSVPDLVDTRLGGLKLR